MKTLPLANGQTFAKLSAVPLHSTALNLFLTLTIYTELFTLPNYPKRNCRETSP